jgi:Rrf2 family transcriptional regulator, iron-sulfur cluster assembly transcription factor
MIFSKSFGYALRGILYVAAQPSFQAVQLTDIAAALEVPRPFMGKIMKRLVQENILTSQKGPTGGFRLNDTTLLRPLLDVYRITDRPEVLDQCVLIRKECSLENPCQLHHLVSPLKFPIQKILIDTTIGDLLAGKQDELQMVASFSVNDIPK